jgi:Pvc16 N-terminal domain
MLHEVDAALQALVRRHALNGSDVNVALDAPTRDWAARRNAPTVDMYLYDIRESTMTRTSGRIDVRGDDGLVTERHQPPRQFKLSYLVTAWTQRPEDEHRLLSACLSCFLRHDCIPQDDLSGSLAEMGMPVMLTVAVPPPDDRAISDIWSALGGELKPSIDVVVLAPMLLERVEVAAPPVTEEPKIRLQDGDGAVEEAQGRDRDRPGRSSDAEDREPEGESVATGGAENSPGRIIRSRWVPPRP